jgi:hypothetical protein
MGWSEHKRPPFARDGTSKDTAPDLRSSRPKKLRRRLRRERRDRPKSARIDHDIKTRFPREASRWVGGKGVGATTPCGVSKQEDV